MGDNLSLIASSPKSMNLKQSQNECPDQRLQHDDGAERKQAKSHTPPRLVLVDEISPTDTVFSDKSVFDSPYPHSATNPGSPATPFGGHDDVFVDIPKTIAVGPGDAWNLSRGTKIYELQKAVDIRRGEKQVNPRSNIDESSVAESDADTEAHDYKEPVATVEDNSHSPRRLVSILSCWQCVLAGLPCSRTYPACSRCERAGRADTCLLFRRKTVQESTRTNTDITPTLLLVEGEDESFRQNKLALLGELHQKWRDDLDRKNWVYPPIESKLGTYRTHRSKIELLHPGEGIGQVVIRELPLAGLHSAG
ncbi:hypothetical protein K491DRAFT_779654 [Lophiostoma macrostomum CBS 122681]|uniref:Zn(2)-C6 fungal-type domain-containing protein n=1 Tax=Lophiostoma macrostomum CBS 122681 TaxID=1314788 RepID=A0A6A6T380_9PLEO|nr:hypothetical protein K491DRAFT_779654 [Lophiostoma macrostomum CBS 122681]